MASLDALLQYVHQDADQQHYDCASRSHADFLNALHPRTDTLVPERADLFVRVELCLGLVDRSHGLLSS